MSKALLKKKRKMHFLDALIVYLLSFVKYQVKHIFLFILLMYYLYDDYISGD